MFIISISLGGPSTSSKRHLCRGKLQKVCGGYFGSTPNIAVGTQKHIFDKLLYNFTSNNIHHQMLLFADKQNFEKNISACRQKHSQQMLLEDKKYFCNKIFWFAIQNIFVTKYSGLQAKNWAGELISGQTRAGKILVKYTILDLLHMRKIGVEMRK